MNTFSRARTTNKSERGIVLIAALVLAVLYFGLMELMMIDASRSLGEAQRFRARVVAETLAENGAELAAANMLSRNGGAASYTDDQGTITGKYRRIDCCAYELTGTGQTAGVIQQSSSVRLQGRIDGTAITIDYAEHPTQ
ncbi:MAG: hypothetical protein ACXVH7_08680 [Thermoanaerobaculia bacterium]